MKTLLEIFDVKEAYKLPDKIMEALMSDRAEKIIREVKDNAGCDLRDIFQFIGIRMKRRKSIVERYTIFAPSFKKSREIIPALLLLSV